MTLDEAIQHCDMKYHNFLEDTSFGFDTEEEFKACIECAKEHEQLRDWLIDYKRLKEKDTPKKVKVIHSIGFNTDLYICPNCECAITDSKYHMESVNDYSKNYNNCWNCGQHLDWSEEE